MNDLIDLCDNVDLKLKSIVNAYIPLSELRQRIKNFKYSKQECEIFKKYVKKYPYIIHPLNEISLIKAKSKYELVQLLKKRRELIYDEINYLKNN